METERDRADVIRHYVKEASSLAGSSLTELIIDATSDPHLFAFSEILDVPAVAELEGTEQSRYIDLLRLFAYGTWSDYKNNDSSQLKLGPEQVLELKQLTVLSVAQNYKLQVLPYDALKQAIDVTSFRELEDFLINACIYMGIVKGKLNQLRSCFEVQYVAERDPAPGRLENMINTLSSWLSTSDKLLLAIEENAKQAETMYKLDMKQVKADKDKMNQPKEGSRTRSKRKRIKAP